jgi:carboxylesterase type B
MILDLCMLSVPFPVFIHRYVTLDVEVHNISMASYLILDLVFWFGHLSILTKNHYSITQHDMNLSSNMISDLAYFARKGKMPWKCKIER